MSPHRREAAPAFSRAAIRLRPGDPAVPPLPGSVPAVRRVGVSCRLSAWCASPLFRPTRTRRHAASLRRSRLGRMVPVRLQLQGVSKLPCNPSSSTGRATLPEPHPPDADQGGPDRARERRGPRCIRSVRRGPRAGLPARRFGACRPVLPCSRRARSGGWLARTVVPSAPGAGKEPRSERRLRRRGGRRPRPDLEMRSGLHAGAVKGDGPGMGGEPLPLRRRTRPA